jgi:hypothetical protein
MSTKIWQAWRLPKTKLNEFLLMTRTATMEKFYGQLDDWMWCASKEEAKKRREAAAEKVKAKNDGVLPSWWYDDDETYLRERWRMVQERIKEASVSPKRMFHDADASLNIWIDGRYAYVIPYGEVALHSPWPDWLEDYHYQNQTDRPEEITARQWTARKRAWDRIALDDWNATRLEHSLISFSKREAWQYSFLAEVHLGLIKIGKGEGDAE